MDLAVNKLEQNNFILVENDKGHNIKLDFKWINLNEIDKFDIRPKFLKDLIKNNKLEFNHLIFDEVNR